MLKLVEVLVLLCAGALFVVWQWRDLRKAREQTRRQREAAQDASRPKGPHGT
ncbi:MAG: hypothetical protein QE283_00725 [Rhodoferax sp.]|nr:hypothetical protein [Rhodoferax sp.]